MTKFLVKEITMKLYAVTTQTLALYAFKQAGGSGVPALNDHLGELCHPVLADACASSVEVSESLEVKEALAAVFHIEYDDELHARLVAEGHIKDGQPDNFGKPRLAVSAFAAATLNRLALVTVSFPKLDVLIRNLRPANELLN